MRVCQQRIQHLEIQRQTVDAQVSHLEGTRMSAEEEAVLATHRDRVSRRDQNLESAQEIYESVLR